MKRFTALLLFLALLLSGCGRTPVSVPESFSPPESSASIATPEPIEAEPAPTPEMTAEPSPSPEPEPTPAPESDTDIRAKELLSGMTPEEKVWQLFMVWPDQMKKDGYIIPVGGVILNASNMVSEEQTSGLITSLQSDSAISLLVAVDEEGGSVARVGPTLGKTVLHSMYSYRGEGPDTARDNACMLAKDIASVGFNVDFAPVADVWTNPENTVIGRRAYSDDPAEAAELVAAAVEGFHQGGVAATLKHFPGHGNTAEDSHNGAAYTDKTLADLYECELLPFISGIEAGADMVMIGHITATAIDPEYPATLSKPIVTGLLREQLGFDGVVVTDALAMGAITGAYGAEASLLALEAGCDLLLAPSDAQTAAALILEKADMDRVDESVLRILRLKLELGIIE